MSILSLMKLYVTDASPYARIARIVVRERALEQQVEIVKVQTRIANNPYYQVNASGRVPYLVRDDGVGMEESALICAYLDQAGGGPGLGVPSQADRWEGLRLEALARSMLDGLSVWLRERHRPENERSPTVLEHEAGRSARMVDLWETLAGHPLMSGPLNMLHITLACALGLEVRLPAFRWRTGHPLLEQWYEPLAARPSFALTAPPPAK